MQGSCRHPTVRCQVGRVAKRRVDLPDLTPASLYPAVVRADCSMVCGQEMWCSRWVEQEGRGIWIANRTVVAFASLWWLWGLSPHLLLWCGLKAANAVGWERTPLFSLLQRAENNANYAQAHFIITNKDAGVLLRSWDLCRKKQGVHRCWGAMKEKADIGPVSFIGEEKNNILGLNIIYVGVVVIIRLVFPVGCFSARCNGTFLQHACVYMMCVWWSSLAFSDVRKLHLTGEA